MLLTPWVTLGKAGPTKDGREITEQDLKDAAESYDQETYTAVINSDHMLSWYGNFGTVQQVRLGTAKDGATCLQGQLSPNVRLVEMNRNGQRLFPSMELQKNFANTGKTYLVGLAMTDEPASLGTSMIKFSAQMQERNIYMAEPAAEHITFTPEQSNAAQATDGTSPAEPDDTRNLLQKFISLLRNEPEAPSGSDTDQEDDDTMKPEQFTELKQLFTDQNAAYSARIDQLISAMKPGNDDGAEGSNEKQGEDGDTGNDQFTTLKTEIQTLTGTVTALQAELATFKQEKPGTEVPEGTGGGTKASFV
ncbi:hypothetical protein GCM10023116_13110 [Kistimonas scapharcae]|uniref:Uncharacterized protein n=1 Tax=Kistimonas scapharcae TaxID=1036133 RepID=A0ABP8V2F4_9GAMM